MKISHTLIHNGISYGIPEGTKVPEKPRWSMPHPMKADYAELMRAYNKSIQALLSVSIQWEDQEAVRELLREHFELIPDGSSWGVTLDLKDGIYPLEGVNAKVVQIQIDCPDKKDGCEVLHLKTVLRLIPQPNSEQTNPMDEYIADLPDTRELVNSWIGVDEKKEPETTEQLCQKQWQDKVSKYPSPSLEDEADWYAGQHYGGTRDSDYVCQVARWSYLRGHRTAESKVGGVSEEEPTDLWTELITDIQRMEVVDAIDYAKSKYHIQKLKQ